MSTLSLIEGKAFDIISIYVFTKGKYVSRYFLVGWHPYYKLSLRARWHCAMSHNILFKIETDYKQIRLSMLFVLLKPKTNIVLQYQNVIEYYTVI